LGRQLYNFDGVTYDPRLDQVRLSTQLVGVRNIMLDGRWHTITELMNLVGGTATGISARIRDLRKARFGRHLVEGRRVAGRNGLWEYRIVVEAYG